MRQPWEEWEEKGDKGGFHQDAQKRPFSAKIYGGEILMEGACPKERDQKSTLKKQASEKSQAGVWGGELPRRTGNLIGRTCKSNWGKG